MNSAIKLNKISKTFNDKKALTSVKIKFHRGEWTYIIGENGSGKTTLLKLMSGEYLPDKGNINLFDNVANKNIPNFQDFPIFQRSKFVHFIGQNASDNHVGSMSIYENMILGIKPSSLKSYQDEELKHEIIRILKLFKLGLENRLNEQVRFLSGGEQQVLVAAKVMLIRPQILLMDEFTSFLDQKIAPKIITMLKEFTRKSFITTLIVTHNYRYINDTAERLLIMKNGKFIGDYHKKKYELSEQFILMKLNESN